jgi:trk system potassium uptake protein TrkA
MRVIIVGMGHVGSQLARELSQRKAVELVLIDSDAERCRTLADELDALVLEGDGTDPDLLKKADVKNADALVAATHSDALNTVVAMLGKQFSVETIIVKLDEVGLRTACQEIGVSHIISPKLSAVTEIISVLYGYNVLDFSMLIKGGVRLGELRGGEMTGKRLEEIEFPPGTLVIAVFRDDRIVVPAGQARIQEDDRLLIIAETEKSLSAVRNLWKQED